MNFSRFSTISFDCYGTLIDWEAGILPCLRGLLASHGQTLPDGEILALYGEFEADAESGPYQTHREVLRSVVRKFGGRLRFEPSAGELNALHESVSTWPPFSDTVQALRQLQKSYKLVIISNIDDDLFAETQKLLGINFNGVITAQQAQSYKPSLNNFQLTLGKLALSAEHLLHVGQSIYHDVVPARSLGISTVWVNRKSARPGIGAVRSSMATDTEKRPDLEVPDLASLAAVAMGTAQR